MAQIPLQLIVDGLYDAKNPREVSTFSMSLYQATDMEGQVTGLPRGGKITMRVKALNDGNYGLACWMANAKKTYNGKIIFYETKENKLMKTLEFKDAYCVEYQEYRTDAVKDDELAHWEEFTISCREITDGGILNIKNTWELVK